jgi:hypothetical protein
MMGGIFVQIPSYRDAQLIPTLLDLIRRSSAPGSISVCICWQHANDETIENFTDAGFTYLYSESDDGELIHFFELLGAHIKFIDVNYLDTLGCGWARYRAQRHHGNERYSLQIDAHHRFVTGWDTLLIDMLESIRSDYKKPVITGYPPPFYPDLAGVANDETVYEMVFDRFSAPGFVHFRPSRIVADTGRPIRSRFLSGGFIFSDSSFLKDVPNDPAQFFSSEEITRTVRAFMSGYDFFSPHRVILWHQYVRAGQVKVWDDLTIGRRLDGSIAESAAEKSLRSYDFTVELLKNGLREGHGCEAVAARHGTVRSLEDYEYFSGIDFRLEAVTLDMVNGHEPEPFRAEREKGRPKYFRPIHKIVSLPINTFLSVDRERRKSFIVARSVSGTKLFSREVCSSDIAKVDEGEYLSIALNFLLPPEIEEFEFFLEEEGGLRSDGLISQDIF